jgi:hypothetical protein
VRDALGALESSGWSVEYAAKPRPLPLSGSSRHPQLPPLASVFFTNVASCVDPDDGSWFLAADDFAATESFRWDEFERMVAENEPAQEREARTFWDGYLPIYQIVSEDYQYLALGTDPSSEQFGKVVWGDVADYDNPLVIADSYEEFLDRLRDIARRDRRPMTDSDRTIARLIHTDLDWLRESWGSRLKRWLRAGG